MSSWAMDAGSSGCRSVCPLLGHRSVQDDKKNDDEDYICHTSPLPQDHWGISVYQYVFGTSRPDKCNLHAIFATTVLSLATESSLKSGCCIYRNLDPFPVSGRAKLIVMQAASLPAGSVSGANFHTYSAFLTHRQSRVILRVSSERGWNRPRPQQVPPQQNGWRPASPDALRADHGLKGVFPFRKYGDNRCLTIPVGFRTAGPIIPAVWAPSAECRQGIYDDLKGGRLDRKIQEWRGTIETGEPCMEVPWDIRTSTSLLVWAIILLSCLVGSATIVQGLDLGDPLRSLAFVALVVAGVFLQARLMTRSGSARRVTGLAG